MSAGTDASIFGYGEKTPESNVDSSMANKFNSHFSGTFGSDEIPTAKPYPGIGPGSLATMSGGRKHRGCKHRGCKHRSSKRRSSKRRGKRGGGCGCNSLFGGKRRSHTRRGLSLAMSRARSMARSRSIAGGSRRRKTKRLILGRSGGSRRRKHRGGVYQQFMSNIASTPGYAVGAPLSASTSALANPPPIQVYNHSTTPFSETDRA